MSSFKPQEKKKKQTQQNKPICADASQNGPHSYTNLAMEFRTSKDSATVPPFSQSYLALAMDF